MIVIYILLLVVFGLITRILYEDIFKINFLYTLLWCIGGILVCINYLGMYSVSIQVHIFIILSVVTFNSIYFLKERKKYIKFRPDWNLSKKMYNFLFFAPNYV